MIEIPVSLQETLAGRYVLKREIGRGGAAAVYLAHDLRHERLVAIKVLHAELSHALGAQRFLREIKLMASLQHPHILTIHDSGALDDQLYYVMPYVEGDSMRQRLGADNRLSIEEAVRIGREVAGALAYAHEHGIVHRDIKPENILFSGGHAVLADFGIARAINRAHEKITQSGTITGTPAYMSPEQARDRAFDGRSDVYSLACVLYEAIAGVPPFVGETPQVLLTQRITRVSPLLREYRHDVPAPIEAVIAKALSISPDDRYDDARAFSAALSAAIGNSGETLTARAVRRPLRANPWTWVAGVTLLVAGVAATSPTGRDQIDVITGRIDTAQYAVAPFYYEGSAAPVGQQDQVAQGLYSALREWNGLKVASDMSVRGALGKAHDPSLEGHLQVARSARSGKLVWGRVWTTKDSLYVRAGVYDAIEGNSLREVTIGGPLDMLEREPGRLRTLAADLLRIDGVPRAARGGEIGTRSLAAWRHYEIGQRELARWRVPAAVAAFQRSVSADDDYASPRVWLAQLQLWQGAPVAQWSPHVSAAIRHQVMLDERARRVASALQAVQRSDLVAAERVYAEMRAADSLDVVAWLGTAYCAGMDRTVVSSRASRTGFAFRTSMNAAQHAYARAMLLAPGAFAVFPFEVVRRLYTIEMSVLRAGSAADSTAFFAYPDLIDDTLAFVPRPVAQSGAAAIDVIAPRYDRALRRNRENLLALLATLTQRIPENPDVFESLARVLEMRDEITGTPNGGYSALSALERARLLATDSAQRARIGASDVRLHLKLGDFSRTYAIADSMLVSMPRASGATASHLVGVAALLGREHDAIALARASGESVVEMGLPTVPLLEEVATALFMRAALGACDDSLRALHRKAELLLDSYVSDAQRDLVRHRMLQRPLSLGLGCFGPRAVLSFTTPSGNLMVVHQAFARGDIAGARAKLDSIQGMRGQLRPGEYSLDFTMAEAWLRAGMGDTAAAVRQLDRTLTALPTLAPHVLFEPGMAAAVGRSMALRAELAARQRDRGTAALWAGRVLTLWARPDPSLAPTIARMKALTAQRL